MVDLGVKLDAVLLLGEVLDRADRRVGRTGNHLEPLRYRLDMVAVALV